MKPVFTSAQMRDCDAAAINTFGIPSVLLMENAARGAADGIELRYGPLEEKHCVILCGKGNNGGDGFALARHLLNRGMDVHVVNIGPDTASKGDARINLDLLRKTEIYTTKLRVSLLSSLKELEEELTSKTDFVIDALLGTGLASALKDEIAEVVPLLNALNVPVIALDVPTGINADNGEVMAVAVKAAYTITMGGLKNGLLFGRGKEHAGETSIVDIGMPRQGYFETATDTFQLEERDIVDWLPRRDFDVHKYKLGKIFVLAGSIGLTGAAAMASEASLRTGAGIVKLGIPESLNHIMETKLTEVMTLPFKETSEGSFSLNSLDAIMEMVNSSTVSIVGPGISRQYETQSLVRKVVQLATAPLVLDADALFALIGHLDLLLTANAHFILTPHTGEFARLIDQSIEEITPRKVELARIFATEFGVTLVLKGAPSIIAAADGKVYINSTGNPGMATAGSGDVLSGVIAGLIAQGASAEKAAACGVFLHGLAGDKATEHVGEYGLIATDMLHGLAETLRSMSLKFPKYGK